jgi:hypothetical protein
MTTDILSTEWLVPLYENQKDAVWFYGHKQVATTTLTLSSGETYTLDIHCDGETRYHVPNLTEDGKFSEALGDYKVVRYPNEWQEVGVNSDADIQALGEKLYALGHSDFHVYNSWFDLYVEIDGVSQHLDSVTHDIDDAERQAEAVLLEVATHGGWKQYLNTLGWDYQL